jgi:hypothetical protein
MARERRAKMNIIEKIFRDQISINQRFLQIINNVPTYDIFTCEKETKTMLFNSMMIEKEIKTQKEILTVIEKTPFLNDCVFLATLNQSMLEKLDKESSQEPNPADQPPTENSCTG